MEAIRNEIEFEDIRFEIDQGCSNASPFEELTFVCGEFEEFSIDFLPSFVIVIIRHAGLKSKPYFRKTNCFDKKSAGVEKGNPISLRGNAGLRPAGQLAGIPSRQCFHS